MQFQVPQFLEIEDRLFGFLTFRQFLYLGGGAGFSYILWAYLPKWAAVPFILVAITFTILMAFYKINNKPFIHAVEAFIRFALASRLYIWRKIPKKIKPKKKEERGSHDVLSELQVPHLSESKLKDLAWSLDIHEEQPRRGV